MIKKNYTKKGNICRTTFRFYPEQDSVQSVALLGEFNQWEPKEMAQRRDGSFSTTISLEAGKGYQFRYLVDEQNWSNEAEADRFERSPFGSQNGVVEI
jgi:1,4-alpha-glucan branching enzyme